MQQDIFSAWFKFTKVGGAEFRVYWILVVLNAQFVLWGTSGVVKPIWKKYAQP